MTMLKTLTRALVRPHAEPTVVPDTDTAAAKEGWVQLHVGDPGNWGYMQNVAKNDVRKPVVFAGGINIIPVCWVDVPATETYTHFTLWTAAEAGSFLASGVMTKPKYVRKGWTFEFAIGGMVER